MSVMNLLPGGSTVQIPLDAPTSFSATAGNAQVELTWTDPLDKYATPEGEVSETGDQLVSEWDHTVLVRKTGSQPAGPNDGTVVVSSSVRNQYQSTGYTDTGLTNDVTYYYGVFAYNKDGVASAGAFVSATPVAGTPLGDLTEGTLITINESGAPIQFYIAKQNYEESLNGAGRVLCVRKDIHSDRIWDDANNAWATSDIRSWLNGAYKSLFSSSVKTLMGRTKYEFIISNAQPGISTRSDSVFLLSNTELGTSETPTGDTGSVLPIYTTLQIAYLKGVASPQWTRSMVELNSGDVFYLTIRGTLDDSRSYSLYGARPCFTLPSTALVDSNNALIETA